MLRKIVLLALTVVLITVFCGCSLVEDTSYSYYVYEEEVIESDKTENDKSKSDKTDKNKNQGGKKENSSKPVNNNEDDNVSSVGSEKGDDFLVNYKIKNYKEKNIVLEKKIAQYQNAITKLGKTYPKLDHPAYSGKTSEEELSWLTDYNNKLTNYCNDTKQLLIKCGRESVKLGVNGDISAAYEWAKTAFDKSDNLVALTYDDAPNGVAHDLLDGLKERNVSAVFFVIGNKINETNASQIQRMIDEGHIVGNHSMSHVPLYHKYKDKEKQSGDLLDPELDVTDLSKLLQQKFGYNDFLLRVPGLMYNKTSTSVKYASNGKYDAKTLSQSNNLVLVDAAVGMSDADGNRSADDTYSDLMKVKPGSIVIMHAVSSSAEASFRYIDDKSKEGYTFVTVPELLMVYNGKIDLGVAYKSFDKFVNLP